MKVLVVYYSRTGRTRRLAERLARELHGTTLAITEPRARFGLLGYPRSMNCATCWAARRWPNWRSPNASALT